MCEKLLDNRLVIAINVNQVEALDEIVPVSQRQNRWSHLKRRLSEFALINQALRALLSLEAPLLVNWWSWSRVELYREHGLAMLVVVIQQRPVNRPDNVRIPTDATPQVSPEGTKPGPSTDACPARRLSTQTRLDHLCSQISWLPEAKLSRPH